MDAKVSFILTLVIIVLSIANSILNIIGGNYGLSVIWGAVAVLNIISIVLRSKKR
ncbi:MAG: hypothetical protein ACI4J0_04210 [Huintestinicola sp.]|uniref:hypothetical protein n=1 Tax=Huintestinicola sp. TaxID=2981661 RepID=UPI003F04139F